MVPVQIESANPQQAAMTKLSTTLCVRCSLIAFEMLVGFEMLVLQEWSRVPQSLQ
jgi:hypothetical protein